MLAFRYSLVGFDDEKDVRVSYLAKENSHDTSDVWGMKQNTESHGVGVYGLLPICIGTTRATVVVGSEVLLQTYQR